MKLNNVNDNNNNSVRWCTTRIHCAAYFRRDNSIKGVCDYLFFSLLFITYFRKIYSGSNLYCPLLNGFLSGRFSSSPRSSRNINNEMKNVKLS